MLLLFLKIYKVANPYAYLVIQLCNFCFLFFQLYYIWRNKFFNYNSVCLCKKNTKLEDKSSFLPTPSTPWCRQFCFHSFQDIIRSESSLFSTGSDYQVFICKLKIIFLFLFFWEGGESQKISTKPFPQTGLI